jgi:hypothetical protein
MNDTFTDAINAPAGRLAEILLKKMPETKKGGELGETMRRRLDRLVAAPGRFGILARVRLAADVSFLFHQAPEWTKERIVPLFDWNSPEASAVWGARKYSNYFASPELFALMKRPFLALFTRRDVPEEEVRTFSEWLTSIMLANQSGKVAYPVTATEARSVLRMAGARSLSSVAHQLALEMEHAKPEERVFRWRNIVGPVFQNIWPLDIELQSSQTTFKLVQILRASGAAFPEAADMIIPFIRPDDPRQHSSVFSISNADDQIYSASPGKLLDLLTTVVGEPPARSVYALGKALIRVKSHAPELANTRKFQRLLNFASVD